MLPLARPSLAFCSSPILRSAGLLAAACLAACSSSSDSGSASSEPPPVLSFGLGSLTESEVAPQIRVPIVLDRAAPEPLEVQIQLGGSASSSGGAAAADYELVGGTLVTIPMGSLGLDLVLVPVDDGIPEGGETIVLQLADPSIGAIGNPSLAEVVLLDGTGPGGGTSAPFGTSLLMATNLINLAGPRVHTAGETAGSSVPLSPAGVQAEHPALSPNGESLAYEGVVMNPGFVGVYVLDREGGQIVEASGLAVDGRGPFAWAPDSSTLAFHESFASGLTRVAMVDADGQNLAIVSPPGTFTADASLAPVRWSPDSQRAAFLAVQNSVSPARLIAVDRDGSNPVELSESLPFEVNVNGTFRWSSDGQWVAFTTGQELYVVQGDGTNLELVTSALPGNAATLPFRFQWSPDSLELAYVAVDPVPPVVRLYVTEPGGEPVEVSGNNFGSVGPVWAWSPAGGQLALIAAYDSNQPELHVAAADGSGTLEVSGLEIPEDLRWSPDGEFLAYRTFPGAPHGVWSVRADGTDLVELTENGLPAEDVASFDLYTWSPDSQRLSFVLGIPGSPEGRVLVSDGPAGGDRIVHFGDLAGPDDIRDHRWSPDGSRLYARVAEQLPGFLRVGLRSLSVDGTGAPVETTSNAYGGDGSVGEFFLR